MGAAAAPGKGGRLVLMVEHDLFRKPVPIFFGIML
jgi:hypothetical protein